MKLRRVILAVVILGGIVLLILGALGVFSPEQKAPPPAAASTAQSSAPLTMKQFRADGDNWTLIADAAEMTAEDEWVLTHPSLSAHRPGAQGEEYIDVSADKGNYRSAPTKKVDLSGNVHVNYRSQQNAELTTDALTIEPDSGSGHAAGVAELHTKTDEGPQTVKGEGLEFMFKERTASLSKKVTVDLSGADVFSEPAPGTPQAPVHITCDGKMSVDGFRNFVEFNDNVHVQQSESSLDANKVDATFDPKKHLLERFTATGNVRFRGQGAEGSAQTMTRDAIGEVMVLEGQPAVVQQAGGAIKADRIELSTTDHAVSVSSGGDAVFVENDPEKPAEPVNVTWTKSLHFNPKDHTALFRGDVHFVRGKQDIRCQRFYAMLDEQNKLKSCRADEDVIMVAENGTAACDSMAYDVASDQATLTGNVNMKQETGTISGDRVILTKGGAAMAVKGKGVINTVGDAETKRRPATVTWTGSMNYDRDAGNARFERDVKLRSDDNTMKSDVLALNLTQSGDIKDFHASGSVSFFAAKTDTTPERTLSADALSGILTPAGVIEKLDAVGHAKLSEKAADGSSNEMEAEKIAAGMGEGNDLKSLHAERHVVVRSGKRILHADKVDSEAGADQQISDYYATGHVTVEEGDMLAIGTHLRWNLTTDSGTLTGNPAELRQKDSRNYSDKVEFARGEGRIQLSGKRRVEGSMPGDTVKSGMQMPLN